MSSKTATSCCLNLTSKLPLASTQLLFSYGTLQLTPVQMSTFGRPLKGTPDALDGWEQSFIEITDPDVLATSGETFHPILRYTGNASHFVLGSLFEITTAELKHADSYEVDDYERIKAALRSGKTAWIYVEKGGGRP